MLHELLDESMQTLQRQDEHWFDFFQNARAVADAEEYYRIVYYGGPDSWNPRGRHMF